MQTYPKKHIVILVIAVILVSLIFTILVQFLNQMQLASGYVSAQWLLVWKVVAIISILYGFVRLWFWPRRMLQRIAARPPRQETSPRRISPETGVLLLCYAVLASPNLYGLILFFWGLPIAQFYYFAGAAVAGGLIWGFLQSTQ